LSVAAQDPYASALETIRLQAELLRAKDQIIASQQATIAALTMPGGSSPLTTNQVYQRFEAAQRGRKSWKQIRNRLRAFLVEFGDQPAMSVTPPKWAAFRERRKTGDEKLGPAVAPITINFELDWSKRMFSWATEPEQNLLPSNPLEKAKREKTDSARETWLTEEQLAKLLHHSGALIAAFVLVAVDTGKRISEVLTLRRDRLRFVDLTDGRRFALGDISKRLTKSKRANRAVLTPRCLAALELLPKSDVPFLFPSPKKPGSPYGARHIAKLFRAACVASGIDVFVAEGDGHIRAHDLRHTAATAAARRGATLPQVQQLLNHSSPSITMRYVHLDEDDALAMAQIIDAGATEERRGPRRVAPTVERRQLRVA